MSEAEQIAGEHVEKDAKGPSQASQLVKVARDRFELFMSDDGRPYAVRKEGPNLALPLRGKAGLRSTLAKIYTDEQGGAVPSQLALGDAMTVLEGVAQAAGLRTAHLRVAWHDGGIVVDLGTIDGRCVVIRPDGWSRESRSPVLFRRSGAMKALPDPVCDGNGLAKLYGLLNMEQDAARKLVGWLVAAFIPDLPHPILTFRGGQGTGKSKTAQMVIGIVDPPARCPEADGAPGREVLGDAGVQLLGLCLDNISYVPDWLSDATTRPAENPLAVLRKLEVNGRPLLTN